MKLPIKFTLLLASVAVLGTSAASADDQHLQRRLTAAQSENSPRTTSVAVYANQRGVGNSAAQNQSQGDRFEIRATAHGQVYGAYVAGN